MRFGLDGIPLTELKTGVGHYTLELARALAEAAPEARFDLVYPSSFAAPEGVEGAAASLSSLPENLRTLRVPVGALGRHWWSIGLPRFLKSARVYDLFHGTNFDVPLWSGCPAVVTVHDLSTHLHPSTHERRRVLRARRRLPLMARRARAIITPTECVRREVCERLRVAPGKVFAVPEAPRAVFRPASAEEAADVRRKLGVRGQFVLAVGTVEPRKNLLTLLRAFEEVARESPARELQLVVAGKAGWLNRDLYAAVEKSPAVGRVLFTGYLTDEDLRALYSSCRVFVYPSLYEGFGLPPVEAMACGAPVVCSRILSLTETTNGAALLFDPHNAAALARALVTLLDDDGAARNLSAAGLKRAADFSWARTARMTLEVYREALGRRVV